MMPESSEIEKSFIEIEIFRARDLYEHYGRAICADRIIGRMLTSYYAAASSTRETMDKTGMIRACSACSRKGNGSCCFREVENWYDFVLLLINLLLGVEIPYSREVADNCFFLGQNGCKLLAKHSFCLNYLCPDLKDLLGPLTTEFSSIAGHELLCEWELERALRIWIHENGM